MSTTTAKIKKRNVMPEIKLNDELEVNIEKLSNLGLGIAKVDGFVIFVENACPQDVLKIKITKVTKNYAKAKILEVMSPSKHRTSPFCPMQKVCGACQLQYINYNYQLELKREVVQDAIRKIGHLDIEIPNPVPSPLIKAFRHKIQYPVCQTKVSKRLLAGYYKPHTHDIVNIKYCPIQPEICDKIVDFIREKAPEYRISGYDEKKHAGDLKHIVIRNSAATGENLVVLVVNSKQNSTNYKNLAQSIYENFAEVSGVCLNYNTKKTNVIMSENTECICGKPVIEEKILGKTFYIGTNTFFQVNPKSAENIFRYVKDYIAANFENPVVLDAYAGISAFGICVSDVCDKVVSVEENTDSCRLAEDSLELNNINNLEIHNEDAAKFFAKEKRKFDAVILDPPRKGCSVESLDEAVRLCNNTIIYVSCNPATLARDLKYLTEKGCRVQSIQPFDMFCHSFHIENVAIIQG